MRCEMCDFCANGREQLRIHYRNEHSDIAEIITTHDVKPTELSRCNICGTIAPTIELFEHFLLLHTTPVLRLVAKL